MVSKDLILAVNGFLFVKMLKPWTDKQFLKIYILEVAACDLAMADFKWYTELKSYWQHICSDLKVTAVSQRY